MTAMRRWLLVAAAILALVAAPAVSRALPVENSEISATRLLALALDSERLPYSGYVETVGAFTLPPTDQFNAVANLLGQSNELRVWWRSAEDWRVDRLATTGETDLFHADGATTSWNYEGSRATETADALALLPRSVDLLPPTLTRRVLAQAQPDEVSRLPATRVAGHSAPGLRLTPALAQASIDHVDIWVEPQTGLPLRVEVWAAGAASPAFTSAFADVSLSTPASEVTTFEVPPGVTVSSGGFGEDSMLAHIVGTYRGETLAGLPLSGGAGFAPRYGNGVTQLLVLAVDDEVADPLRDQLARTPGSTIEDDGTLLGTGPLSMMLSPCLGDRPSWLLLGTVDDRTLHRAAQQIYGSALDEAT
jgi:outer membrane lipoprotein-sorting protein